MGEKMLKDKTLSFFENSINKTSKILMIFCLSFCLLSIFFLQQNNFDAVIKVCGIIVFAVFIFIAYKVSSLIKSDRLALGLVFSVSMLFLLAWNLIYDAKPVSDYEVLLSGANSIIDGDFLALSSKKDNYFYFYNFQIGYTFYLSILLRIFGGNLFALKIIEIIVISLCNVFVFKIMRIFFTVEIGFFSALLMIFNPFIFMGSGIINNQHISCLLCLISIYIYLKNNGFLKNIYCGILIAFSQVLRPTSVIVLIAFLICSFIYGLFKKNKKILLGCLVLLATYLIAFNIINWLFILSDLAPCGIKNSNPYFKLVLGLTGKGVTGIPTTDAYKTQLYYDLESFGFDYDAYKIAAREHLKNLVLKGGISYHWVIEKMVYFTGEVDNQYHFADAQFNTNHQFLVGVSNFVGVLIYFASVLFSFIRVICEKETVKNKSYMLFILIFGLFFFAYVFIETQPRYRYEQYYVLFFLSMPVFYSALDKLKENFINKEIL